MRRSRRVTDCGAYGSENVGMSNRNEGESPSHRKSEVSWAMVIIPGLVGPKARLKSVVDGHQVNIPELFVYSKERRISVLPAPYWIGVWSLRTSCRQIRMAHSPMEIDDVSSNTDQEEGAGCQENLLRFVYKYPYRKPTQVDRASSLR